MNDNSRTLTVPYVSSFQYGTDCVCDLLCIGAGSRLQVDQQLNTILDTHQFNTTTDLTPATSNPPCALHYSDTTSKRSGYKTELFRFNLPSKPHFSMNVSRSLSLSSFIHSILCCWQNNENTILILLHKQVHAKSKGWKLSSGKSSNPPLFISLPLLLYATRISSLFPIPPILSIRSYNSLTGDKDSSR